MKVCLLLARDEEVKRNLQVPGFSYCLALLLNNALLARAKMAGELVMKFEFYACAVNSSAPEGEKGFVLCSGCGEVVAKRCP